VLLIMLGMSPAAAVIAVSKCAGCLAVGFGLRLGLIKACHDMRAVLVSL
jgi:hypothetical protein